MGLLVVIPFYSEFDFLKPFLRELRDSDIPHAVQPVQGCYISANRNDAVNLKQSQKIKQFARNGFENFLFCDSDTCPTVPTVKKLLSHNLPIVGAPYLRHEADGTYQAGFFNKDFPGDIETFVLEGEYNDLHEVDFLGGGCVLAHRAVFPSMRYPWFRNSTVEYFGSASEIREDVGFCLNAREAGIKIHCDFSVPVLHKPRKMQDYDISY